MSSRRITTKEILRQTGIKSGKTLTRWHQDGLIPPPEMGPPVVGRGRVAYWPHWVVDRCRTIRQMVKDGKILAEVREILGSDWSAEEAKAGRRRDWNFAEVAAIYARQECERNFIDEALDRVLSIAGKSGGEYPELLSTLMRQLDGPMAKKSLELVRSGYSPVLIFDNAQLDVVPDFMLTHLLSAGQSIVVVPIFDEVVKAFRPSFPDLPTRPTVTQVMIVQSCDDESVRQFAVVPVGDRDFELVDKTDAQGSAQAVVSDCEPKSPETSTPRSDT